MTEGGYDSFYRERYSKTVVLLIAMGAGRADAEDATQEAMIMAWTAWNTIREPAAWVRTVAIRRYWHAASSRQLTRPLDESVPELAGEVDLGIFAEEQQQVLGLLRSLPPEQRTVAVLRFDGATCEEIAALTGKPQPTIRSLLRHARKTLKELMEPGEP